MAQYPIIMYILLVGIYTNSLFKLPYQCPHVYSVICLDTDITYLIFV